jgi:putative hydrolase of the HAD superfamily
MTILFDIGNVLLRFDYKEQLCQLLPNACADGAERLKQLDEKRDELECGRITVDEFVKWALDTLGSTATKEEFIAAWRSIFTPIDETWELARKLAKQGHRLILFSNINAIHSPWIYDEYEIFRLFHGGVMSFEIGYMKPHPQFYQTAIQKWNLIPEETLYIDDLPANIQAGIDVGFHCHCYDWRNHDALEAWLELFLPK